MKEYQVELEPENQQSLQGNRGLQNPAVTNYPVIQKASATSTKKKKKEKKKSAKQKRADKKKASKGSDPNALHITVGKLSYQGKRKGNHAEVEMLLSHPAGDINAEMNAWPCDACTKTLSADALAKQRVIAIQITGDKSGYSKNHGLDIGTTGTITFNKDGTHKITVNKE